MMKARIKNRELRMLPRDGGGGKLKFKIRNSKSARAFTLMEVMIVVAIIGLLFLFALQMRSHMSRLASEERAEIRAEP